MAKKRILILGAGLAGLSAAWHLQRKGIDCLIFEKESEVGGLCRSKKINGFTFDYDGHLLHFRHRYAFNLISSLLKNNLCEHRRSAWIYSYGQYTRYPFQANLYGLPPAVIKECLLGVIKASYDGRLKKSPTFLDWINHTFGKGIAKSFMIPYNTKFWTISPQKLTCEWLDGFIPVPSLNQIIAGTVEESQRQFGYNARFWYPKQGGISELSLALASQIKNIYTNCQIVEINLKTKEIKMTSGDKENFDCLISTLPLPEMPHLIGRLPSEIQSAFSKLHWNSIFNLNLGIDRGSLSDKHWIYFPEEEYIFYRVGFPHNFSSYLIPTHKGSLYVEVSYSKDKSLDKENIVNRIIKDLVKAKILSKDDKIITQDTNDIKYGYIIYDRNYQKCVRAILDFLVGNNIYSIGRYGGWRYMSMEDVILDGREIANKLCGGVFL